MRRHTPLTVALTESLRQTQRDRDSYRAERNTARTELARWQTAYVELWRSLPAALRPATPTWAVPGPRPEPSVEGRNA